MTCKYCLCIDAMKPIGMKFANGWECPVCGHQEIEHASAVTMEDAVEFKEYINWKCECKNCKQSREKETNVQ